MKTTFDFWIPAQNIFAIVCTSNTMETIFSIIFDFLKKVQCGFE